MLSDRVDDLARLGASAVTVPINAIRATTAEQIYSWARYRGRSCKGMEAAEAIVMNQWLGLNLAVRAGMAVKVNTVTIPGVNEEEIPLVAELAGSMGAMVQNITSLIPQGEFGGIEPPSREAIALLRYTCGEHISQISHCKQCRSDAAGLMGCDKDSDMEVLLAKIGDEYADMVNF